MGGSVRLRTTNSLGLLYLPTVSALRTSFLGAGLLLRLTPGATKAVPRDPNPSVAMQQQIPGPLPGTGAIRLAIDDLVRSSVRSLTRELISRVASVLQSNEAPGDCSSRLAATLANSHEVARSFEDSSTPV
jgi:hypothetical protein